MTKNATSVYKYLDNEKINYQIVTHPPVYTAEQADKYVQVYQFARTKNLFLNAV
ncbi:prolyl-tRNA synthetase associated domain-containing protein, partial [Lactobacillus reuteri]|nr:prolyl-tRNA synthetase associated domain-containing protein [Limosilactobacillus reuteri]